MPDYGGINGFLGTRASLMLDVVFLAMFVVVPVLAGSVYLVYVLEILKFRRLDTIRLRRVRPDTTDAEIDADVEEHLETGEFESVRRETEDFPSV